MIQFASVKIGEVDKSVNNQYLRLVESLSG